jgi:acyl-CoA reductase-like NAD-dependent aldehyde dehydrogenase
MLNATCICAKRFIVVDEVADEFIALFANKINL